MTSETPSFAPSHRACDECRARKVACSKELSGCHRCRREGVVCHYSAPKPMGRPRKRRHPDDLPADDALFPQSVGYGDVVSSHALLGLAGGPPWSADAPLDLFGPDAGCGTAFLDLLPSDFADDGADDLGVPGQLAEVRLAGQDGQGFDAAATAARCGGAGPVHDGGLGELAPCAPADVNDSCGRSVDLHRPPYPEEPLPSSCSDLSTAVESPHPVAAGAVKAMPSISCGCLSTLYLALESLVHLPSDVSSAMRVARSACKVAQDVFECAHCSNSFFHDPLKPPPIQAFQNLMFLGALVPSACNAYASILEMVDDEAASAKRESRPLYFSLRDVGGFWCTVADDGHCCALRGLDNRQLKPDVWQRAVRAVLKMDVYGLGDCPSTTSPSYPARKGLKDVLTRLDQISRRRHEMLDELTANGHLPKHSSYLLSPLNQPPCPPEQRNCVRIIEAARLALDSLVIT